MRKTAITTALLGVLLLTATAPRAGASAPRAQLIGLACQRALDPPARALNVTAVMRPLAGTQHLQMRVELLSRIPGAGSYAAVPIAAGSKLGSWLAPPNQTLGRRPGDSWTVSFPVLNLAAPASYRYRAEFRWIGARGAVLATAVRQSAPCYQTERRPDLQAVSLSVHPLAGHPAMARYVALIRNAGATAARSFEVSFSDAAKVRTVTVAELPAHASRRLSFTGPPCVAGAPATVTLDPRSVVDDSNRANDTAAAVCP